MPEMFMAEMNRGGNAAAVAGKSKSVTSTHLSPRQLLIEIMSPHIFGDA